MLKLIIEDDEGRKTTVPFVREEITIGRQEGNTIRLTERNVSRRHARLLKTQGTITVEDLGSYNGIKVNGARIHGQVALQEGDLVQIGDYGLAIEDESAKTTTSSAPVSTRAPDELTQPHVSPLQRAKSPLAVTAPSIPVSALAPSDIPAASDADFEEAVPTDAHQAHSLDSRATESLSAAAGPAPAARASAPLPMLLGLVGLVAGAAIAVWLLKPKESPTIDAPEVKVEVAAQVKTEPPAPEVEDFKPRLDAAQVAIHSMQWDKAKDILESCKTSEGRLISEASKLLAQMQLEEPLKKKLDLAEKALEEGRIQEAGQLLKDSEQTQLLAVQHLELTAQWEDATSDRKQSPPTPDLTKERAPKPPPVALVENPGAFFEKGVSFFKSDRLTDARREFEKCIKADAAFAPCHKGLGGVFAKMGETEKGANHYKTFLKLAPNDKDAAAVQAIVNTYEATLQKN